MVKENHTVLDRSNTVVDTVQKQKSAAGLVDDTSLHEGKFFLCVFGEIGVVVVAIFLSPGGSQPISLAAVLFQKGKRGVQERILMIVDFAQPLRIQEVMTSGAVGNRTSQSCTVRMRRANSIETTRT